jgi:uncharacterized protein (TIGR04255 family)
MSRKYLNPPIIEAVCEFRIAPDTSWDLTTPGFVYEALRKEFPIKEQHSIQEVAVTETLDGLRQELRTNPRMWFFEEDKKLFVQIGLRLLAINCLKPYPTWNGFRPKIQTAFNALTKTVDIKGIQRIGLRYINRIEISAPSIDLEKYFQFRPFMGKDFPEKVDGFITGCVFPFADGRDSCKIQLMSTNPEKATDTAALLDIDFSLAKPLSVSREEALAWVDSAHEKVEEIFEGCITDALREVFEEQK